MSNQVNVPIMWGVRQAVAETGLTEFTIKQLIKSRKIKFIKTGAGQRGKILINADSLCTFMQGVSE